MITNKGIQHHSLYQLMHRFSGRSDQGPRCRQSTNGPSGDFDEESTRLSRRVASYKRETGSSPLADEASDNSSPFDRGTHHRLLSSRPLGARAVSNKNRPAAPYGFAYRSAPPEESQRLRHRTADRSSSSGVPQVADSARTVSCPKYAGAPIVRRCPIGAGAVRRVDVPLRDCGYRSSRGLD